MRHHGTSRLTAHLGLPRSSAGRWLWGSDHRSRPTLNIGPSRARVKRAGGRKNFIIFCGGVQSPEAVGLRVPLPPPRWHGGVIRQRWVDGVVYYATGVADMTIGRGKARAIEHPGLTVNGGEGGYAVG